jgi:hypothetical protein
VNRRHRHGERSEANKPNQTKPNQAFIKGWIASAASQPRNDVHLSRPGACSNHVETTCNVMAGLSPGHLGTGCRDDKLAYPGARIGRRLFQRSPEGYKKE